MRFFNAVVGNPPYQKQVDRDDSCFYAQPLYDKFVSKAAAIADKVSMITPSKWMACSNWHLDEYRMMLASGHVAELHHFPISTDCFKGVTIRGGVSYFLWDRSQNGECRFYVHEESGESLENRPLVEPNSDVVFRINGAASIFRKAMALGLPPVSSIVGRYAPFGLQTNFKGMSPERTEERDIRLIAYPECGWVSRSQIRRNLPMVDEWKLFIPKAAGKGNPAMDVVNVIVGPPKTACTTSYIVLGPLKDEAECLSAASLIATRTAHFLIALAKPTQDCFHYAFKFLPLLELSHPWTDEMLFERLGLDAGEIQTIRESIWPQKLPKCLTG